jgi:hypothetical protein
MSTRANEETKRSRGTKKWDYNRNRSLLDAPDVASVENHHRKEGIVCKWITEVKIVKPSPTCMYVVGVDGFCSVEPHGGSDAYQVQARRGRGNESIIFCRNSFGANGYSDEYGSTGGIGNGKFASNDNCRQPVFPTICK